VNKHQSIESLVITKNQSTIPNQTLSAQLYTDLEVTKTEIQCIFTHHWQLVGHLSQVQKSGDQLVVEVAGKPIVVVRNEKNQLKAFHNVCRHRAGPLAIENNNSPVLRCKYHGWTYDLDGQLKMAPEMDSTANFEVCKYRLPEVKIDVWQNLIFVCLGTVDYELSELIEGIEQRIHPIELKTMSFSHRDEFLIDCDWKVYMDNYLEGYHLPYVHPSLSKLLSYRDYETLLYKRHSYQFSPIKDESALYGAGEAHYYTLFPNMMLNILPGRLQTNVILAEGNQTRVIFDYYYNDLDSVATIKLIEEDKEFSDTVQLEDIEICERVQKGLNSGSYESGPLCTKRESGVEHFQNLYRDSMTEYFCND